MTAPALRLVPPQKQTARLHSPGPSLAERLVRVPGWEQSVSPETLAELGSGKPGDGLWRFWARQNQIAPDWQWTGWLALAGRAWGKTRTAAEWVRERVEAGEMYVALVGATAHDVRTVMVEGESGVLRVFGNGKKKALFESSKRQVRFYNGAIAELHYATEPESLRGPTYGTAWFDEPAKWANLNATWDNAMMCLRGGSDPRWIATTTPLPLTLLRELLEDPSVAVSRGTTYENKANLPSGYYAGILRKYEGTRLGSQELLGEILEIEGALFKPQWFRRSEVRPVPEQIVVAIDPAISKRHDETGIVVACRGTDGNGYVLADKSAKVSPEEWARIAVKAYHDYKADWIVAETNRGGDMIGSIIRSVDRDVAFREVRAFKGKGLRAEPVAQLYEQGRVFHVGSFKELEDQMTTWDPRMADAKQAKSPDRLDALVWAMTELMVDAVDGPHETTRFGRRRW